jgi:putative toxin-antitoxin system antitoxin component (TIGR02293 family)
LSDHPDTVVPGVAAIGACLVENRERTIGFRGQRSGALHSHETELIGDHDEAMRWLGNPVRALDYATPISLHSVSEGVKRVEDVLGQMEHGVW